MTCLDDLIHQHERYLHRVLFRCLLNSKAAPVMKIITDIFGTITRFSSLAGQGGDTWDELEKLYKSFSVYSRCTFPFEAIAEVLPRGCKEQGDLRFKIVFAGFCIQWLASCLQGDTSLICRCCQCAGFL